MYLCKKHITIYVECIRQVLIELDICIHWLPFTDSWPSVAMVTILLGSCLVNSTTHCTNLIKFLLTQSYSQQVEYYSRRQSQQRTRTNEQGRASDDSSDVTQLLLTPCLFSCPTHQCLELSSSPQPDRRENRHSFTNVLLLEKYLLW